MIKCSCFRHNYLAGIQPVIPVFQQKKCHLTDCHSWFLIHFDWLFFSGILFSFIGLVVLFWLSLNRYGLKSSIEFINLENIALGDNKSIKKAHPSKYFASTHFLKYPWSLAWSTAFTELSIDNAVRWFVYAPNFERIVYGTTTLRHFHVKVSHRHHQTQYTVANLRWLPPAHDIFLLNFLTGWLIT